MNDKICLKSLHPNELAQLLGELGQPAYRAKQVFKWLALGVESFDEMTDLPKSLREALGARCFLSKPDIAVKKCSQLDETIKYLFELADGNRVETVLMQYEHGTSICLSTQAGCKMGCVFCASFEKGQTRNLTPAEILDQILYAQKDSGRHVSNIVLMGTGEPLDNYDNVMTFLRLVTHPDGLNIGMRHISLSTCGLVPRIYELAKLKLQLTLSVSLHAPYDELRDRLMPVNKAYPVSKLMEACRTYFEATRRRISFEYAMIDGVNDTKRCAEELIHLLAGTPCHVNLIPLNHINGSPLKPSSRDTIKRFQGALTARGINTTVRRSLGSDIDASCGQLRRSLAEEQGE
ncbi:MAG: 23S rRNA (adenine(2503)-C(2))-methyltransferase RlmN [Clostridia bacterium]|nr:23S rRNA (adenine(2503)-C(2))-methyltransferase RlmN [Clostridia bacterium]